MLDDRMRLDPKTGRITRGHAGIANLFIALGTFWPAALWFALQWLTGGMSEWLKLFVGLAVGLVQAFNIIRLYDIVRNNWWYVDATELAKQPATAPVEDE